LQALAQVTGIPHRVDEAGRDRNENVPGEIADMSQKELMTDEEIHDFGIEVVAEDLKKNGYDILRVNNTMGMNPQIAARKGDQLAFIVVRTACYPDKGNLEEATHFQIIEHADEFDAIPFFASVSIANADATTEEGKGIPVRGAEFHTAYEGLVIISRSDPVQIWEGQGTGRAMVGGMR
jgi:hypothetical protein